MDLLYSSELTFTQLRTASTSREEVYVIVVAFGMIAYNRWDCSK